MEFLAAWLSGTMGSLHCAAMCGGFATACSRWRGGLAAWHFGRIVCYVGLGALAGSVGSIVPGPAWLPALCATLLLLWLTATFAGLLPEPRLIPSGLARIGSRAMASRSIWLRVGFGVLNGFLPCGLVYSGLTVSAGLASPWKGAAIMTAFGLGTVPALSAGVLGLRQLLLVAPRHRKLVAALVLVSGCWAIWARMGLAGAESVRLLLLHCVPSSR